MVSLSRALASRAQPARVLDAILNGNYQRLFRGWF
jgi:hypothetical protein